MPITAEGKELVSKQSEGRGSCCSPTSSHGRGVGVVACTVKAVSGHLRIAHLHSLRQRETDKLHLATLDHFRVERVAESGVLFGGILSCGAEIAWIGTSLGFVFSTT